MADLLDAKYMELHMGILQNKLNNIRGKMQACTMRLNMEKPKSKGIDVGKEKRKFEKLNQEYAQIEEELATYEDKVLDLTAL